MPFKMMGKSPLMKKLVGNQSRLPENLKAKIKAAPESPAKIQGFGAIGQALSNIKLPKFDPKKFESESEKKARLEKESKAQEENSAGSGRPGGSSGRPGGSSGRPGGSSTSTTSGGGKQDRFAKAYAKRGKEYQNMSLSEYTAEAKRQIANRKKTGKYIGGEEKPEVKKQTGTGAFDNLDFTKLQKGGGAFGGVSTKASTTKPKSDFGKKVINRPGATFTDEFGNTYNRSVKGRKKSDGSVSKTITNKRNDEVTSQKDVTKGPKVNGRRTKTVTKTKFTGSGTPRVVTKTKGPGGRRRTVLGDTEAKAKVAELKKRREERDKSPTKMKTKTPNKMMKKSPNKMMKKKSPNMMMKKKSPTMMMKKKSSMKMMKKKK